MSATPEARAEFLRFARSTMRYQPDKYAALVDILTKHGWSTMEARREVEQLLRGQPFIILEFNRLLLPELRIPVEVPFDVDWAFDLDARLKERSRYQEGLYESFLGLLEVYRSWQRPRVEVLIEIVDLLKGHRDLLHDFLKFLRPELRHLASPLPWEVTADFLSFAEIELREQQHKFAALVDILAKQQRSALEVRTQVEQLLRGETLLILKFNDLLPPEIHIPMPEVDVPFDFRRRVEERFRDLRLYYRSFILLVDMYHSGPKPFLHITREIMALLRNHPDLRRDFLGFFPPDVRRMSWSL